jgi:hypothetical protein
VRQYVCFSLFIFGLIVGMQDRVSRQIKQAKLNNYGQVALNF